MIASLLLAVSSSVSVGDAGVALTGFDPVRLCEGVEVAGRDDLEATHGRYTYRFADPTTRERFVAAPERFGIQWGGGCGRMGPLSGIGSPDRWTVHDGRIYIFASDGCRDGFSGSVDRFVVAPVEWPEPSADARAAGAAWIEKAVEAHGGARAIGAVRAMRFLYEAPESGWTHRIERVLGREGELLHRSRWTPPNPDKESSETSWVLASSSFVDRGDEVLPITSPDQIDDLRRFAQREPIALFWQRDDSEFDAVHLGTGELDGRTVENVLVRATGLVSTLHLDPESARVVGISWRGRPNDGVTRDVAETFTGWKSAEGITFPIDRRATADGKENRSLAVAWTSLELLHELAPGAFEWPSR